MKLEDEIAKRLEEAKKNNRPKERLHVRVIGAPWSRTKRLPDPKEEKTLVALVVGGEVFFAGILTEVAGGSGDEGTELRVTAIDGDETPRS